MASKTVISAAAKKVPITVSIETGVFTYGAPEGPTDAWATRYQQVIAFGDTCETQCDADWQASRL